MDVPLGVPMASGSRSPYCQIHVMLLEQLGILGGYAFECSCGAYVAPPSSNFLAPWEAHW